MLLAMDSWALLGAGLMGFRMVSVAFILRKLSPLFKAAAAHFGTE